jgi:hypothetical protein
MTAMRLLLADYNPVKECQGNCPSDETKVAAQILSFQLAEQLLHRYSGRWELTDEELRLQLNGLNSPLQYSLNSGTLVYGGFKTQIMVRYTPEKGLNQLTREIIKDLAFPINENLGFSDPIFSLFVKLIEIFHARCGLIIRPVEKENKTVGWEILLGKKGHRGFISIKGIAENRFGERADLKEWFTLRPEKLAAYVFGFFKFCSNYSSPF